jgi:hypothetical protein
MSKKRNRSGGSCDALKKIILPSDEFDFSVEIEGTENMHANCKEKDERSRNGIQDKDKDERYRN